MKFVRVTLLILSTVVMGSSLFAQTPAQPSVCKRGVLSNKAPTISSFAVWPSKVIVPCPPTMISNSGSCPSKPSSPVLLATHATDPDEDKLIYTYSATGGRITGEGSHVTWDLTDLAPGTYTAVLEVDDGVGCVSIASSTVTIALCDDCVILCVLCPTLSVACPDAVEEGQSATFTANYTQGTPAISETYNWNVSAGTITSGQGTNSITVDTTGVGGGVTTATVEVGGDGIDPACNRTASCTLQVRPRPSGPHPLDQYGNIRFNDEKARLDNFAIQLQNSPTDRGVMIGYGSCEGEGLARLNRAKNYMVKTRGADASRIDLVDGGCRKELHVELWLVPAGVEPPSADDSQAVSPCPPCRKSARGRGR